MVSISQKLLTIFTTFVWVKIFCSRYIIIFHVPMSIITGKMLCNLCYFFIFIAAKSNCATKLTSDLYLDEYVEYNRSEQQTMLMVHNTIFVRRWPVTSFVKTCFISEKYKYFFNVTITATDKCIYIAANFFCFHHYSYRNGDSP